MKFATRQWVRTKRMRVIQIIKESPTHPDYLHSHCDGCHAALAGKPWAAIWAETTEGRAGAYKLCASCAEEAKAEVSARAHDGRTYAEGCAP